MSARFSFRNSLQEVWRRKNAHTGIFSLVLELFSQGLFDFVEF